MKKQMIAIALAASFAAPAFAGGFEEQMFDTQPEKAKVVELSQKEMRETEGAYWGGIAAGAAIGAASGHLGYVGAVAAGAQYSPISHAWAVAGGATLGALSPVSGPTSLINSMNAGALGATFGAMSGYVGTLESIPY